MPYNYPGFTLAHPFPEPRPKERYGYHGGADYAAKEGTPVPCMFGGTVFRSGKIDGYGMAVVIRTETAQGPIYTLYGHLGPNGLPKVTDSHGIPTVIQPGQVIGEVASRAYNETFHLHYNPHLHLEIISSRAELNPTGNFGTFSSDITHRANPETFDINNPKFPYESAGAPPHPSQTGLRAKPPALSSPSEPVAPGSSFGPPPTGSNARPAPKPSPKIGPPLDLTPPEFRNPPATGGELAPPHDPTGSLYFSPKPSLRQFGPFSVPGPFNSGTDILRPRPGSFGNSPISTLSASSHVGNGSVPAAVPQPISGNTADQAGGFSDVGGPSLSQISRAGAVVPTYPDRHDAGDWPRQALPSWVQTQPAPQPAQPVQNLTTRVLRMKGVPEADIGAAISNPAKMQELLNQLYGRRSSTAAGEDSTQVSPADRPDRASTPGAAMPPNYLPFGWAGLQALLR